MGEFEDALAMGRASEESFMRFLAARGHHVIPAYASGEGKAPLVYTANAKIVAADVVAITVDGRAVWFEVKAKSKPGFRYSGPHRGWNHGVDHRHFVGAYRELAARAPLFFVVCEHLTIPGNDPTWTPPPAPRTDRGHDWSDYERHLVPGPVWRWIAYADAAACGYHVAAWANGKAGWLWPVSAMRALAVAP